MQKNYNGIFKNNWVIKHEFKLFGIKIFETIKTCDDSKYEIPAREVLTINGTKFVL